MLYSEPDANDFLFYINRRPLPDHYELLSYTSGRTVTRSDLALEFDALMRRLLGSSNLEPETTVPPDEHEIQVPRAGVRSLGEFELLS